MEKLGIYLRNNTGEWRFIEIPYQKHANLAGDNDGDYYWEWGTTQDMGFTRIWKICVAAQRFASLTGC